MEYVDEYTRMNAKSKTYLDARKESNLKKENVNDKTHTPWMMMHNVYQRKINKDANKETNEHRYLLLKTTRPNR